MASLTLRNIPLLSIVFLLTPIAVQAQNPPAPAAEEDQPPTAPSNSGVYSGREIYVPKKTEKPEPEPAAASFADRFLRDTRQHLGFSLGVHEIYTPDAAVTFRENKKLSFTSVSPQLYLNFQGKKLDFRLNYGASYKRFNGDNQDLNRLSQSGSAGLTYTLSGRKTTFQFSNYLTSMYYDEGYFLSQSATTFYRLDTAPSIYVDRRRETRNTASLNLNRLLTRKSSISTSLNYDTIRYSGPGLPRTSLLSAGIAAEYRITNWLNFNTRYDHYLNNVDQRVGGSSIQSLRAAELAFKPGRSWVVSFSGGIESTKAVGQRWLTASGQAAITKVSARTTVELSFHHGYFKVFPSADVWSGETANLNIVQTLSSRVTFHATGSYIRATILGQGSAVDTIYGATGLDIALFNNLVFSTNHFWASQKLADLPSYGANLHRYTAMAGFNYYLPSFRSERTR